MKAILEFDLNDKDDAMSHMRAVKSFDITCAIFEIVNNIKKNVSYQIDDALSKDKNFTPHDALDIVFDKIQDVIEEHSIDLNELIY